MPLRLLKTDHVPLQVTCCLAVLDANQVVCHVLYQRAKCIGALLTAIACPEYVPLVIYHCVMPALAL